MTQRLTPSPAPLRHDPPAVSVIIPTYNYGRFLSHALDSVLEQTYPAREVIVVDDGSTDETPSVLAHYKDRICVIHQCRSGASAARNAGAMVASGELLAFLDSDDVWLPRKLERQVERLQTEPGLGLIHCGIEEIDVTRASFRRRLDGLEGWVADELLLMRRAVILGGGSGALIPQKVFAVAGGFDESLQAAEDWDLFYRIARRYQVGFVPEVLLQYRFHGANSQMNLRVREKMAMRAYAKAFENAEPRVRRLRRRAYGNLHMALAALFYADKQPVGAFRHALKSVWFTPRTMSLPMRWWRQPRYLRNAEVAPEQTVEKTAA
jgi:glycosyltransferase involved in cell wall biosynthesis